MYKFAALLIILLPSALFSQSGTGTFGVQTHFGQFYRADMDSVNMIKMLDSIQLAGINIIRDECYWADVETVRGSYSFPRSIDNYVNAAAQRGIQIIMILNYNNPLYAPHAGSGIITDSNRTAFASYCSKVVERYSPKGVKTYEIWNEPNIPMFWDPAPNAQAYAALLQAVYPVIKQADSTVTVIGCATSPAEGNPSPFIQWNTFISQVKNYGGLNYLDGVSFHLYRVDRAPELWLNNDINTLQQLIGTDKKIWLTESGYPTSSVWPNLSQLKQAQYIARLFLLGSKYEKLESIIYYDLKNDGEESGNNEHNFGILNYNLSPKPAFTALKTLIGAVGNKSLSSASGSGVLYRYIYENLQEITEVFWTVSSPLLKSEVFNHNTLRVTDFYNNTFYVYDSDKSYPVNYTESPLYITPIIGLPAVQNYFILPDVTECVEGQKLKLTLQGITADSKKLLIDSAAVLWSVMDTLSRVSSGGMLTALHPGTTTVKAVFMGIEVTKSISIIPGYDILEIESFDTLQNINWSFQNMLPQSTLRIVDTNYVTPGNSMLAEYAFNYIGVDQHKLIMDVNYNLSGEPDTLSIDIYNNGNRHVMEFMVSDADGEIFRVNSPPGALFNKFGWNKVSVPLNKFGALFNYPAALTRLTFYFVHNTPDTLNVGNILFDNLRIHNGIVTAVNDKNNYSTVTEFKVSGNYPNPFNPATSIKIQIPYSADPQKLKAAVYNILGQEVMVLADEFTGGGNKQLLFNGGGLPSGVYLLKAEWGENVSTIKMLLLK